ncbi:HAMP domain-containing histidine kinase [Marinomonas sp. C2222]|uniref:histidine kinase n=1 Tax=Marinomonas sargassi TaxID=2984494 RepID=A0ABT2YSP3_9GAMM|nr:HAMP domain-containing sensor histidine kinase [Marinomonas sargassi]MCV2402896.1 HAMP domain-containing histidine kinase [Marinomonas sargassi]
MKKLDMSTILASAIHESKNQMGSLLYQLQELKQSLSVESTNSQKITHIEEALKKLNDDWVEYLYLYKLASDGYELHSDTFLLEEFLDDQVFALQDSAATKNLALSFECDENLHGIFDERLMVAVVSTAVYNAFRFAKTKVRLSASLENGYLIISIEDDGAGFNSEEENIEGAHESGTGLGLYFSQLSAEAHVIKERQGFIKKTASQVLGGAKLDIYLPQLP